MLACVCPGSRGLGPPLGKVVLNPGPYSLLKLMISVRNPCHGSLPETFAFGGAPERGFLAEADHFFNGFLAPQGILGEHVAKHIDICRFE